MIGRIFQWLVSVLIIGVAMALALVLAAPAFAQANCGMRPEVVDMLGQKYGETLKATGLGNGQMIEVWASDASGTWTILSTSADGVSCALLVGTDFGAVKSKPPEPDGEEM